MTTNECYIALGGNLGHPIDTFKAAIELIDSEIGDVRSCSNIYRTAPLNPPELQDTSQPDFLNAVICVESSLQPKTILEKILNIETTLGRNRKLELRWGPRLIDLDLLFVGQQLVETEFLSLPHPRITERDFVLKPLADIAPNFVHPSKLVSISKILSDFYGNNKTCYVLEQTATSYDLKY